MPVAVFGFTKLLEYTPTAGSVPKRTQMSSGVIHQTLEYTSTYTQVEMTFLLTLQQMEDFIVWYSTNAADFFTLENPLTSTNRDYRIVGGYSPQRLETYDHYTLTFISEYLN